MKTLKLITTAMLLLIMANTIAQSNRLNYNAQIML
jgi:hypothetical protein